MFSQVSRLRHTIMAIVTIASLMGLAPNRALADPMTYDFIIDVEGGRSITGRFTGEDKINVHSDPVTGAPTPDHSPVACDGVMVKCDNIIEVGVPDGNGTNTVIELSAITGDPAPAPAKMLPKYVMWINPAGGDPMTFTVPPPTAVGSIEDFTVYSNFNFRFDISSKTLQVLHFQFAHTISCGHDPAFPATSCTQGDSVFIQTTDTGGSFFDINGQSANQVLAGGVPEPSTAVLLSIGLVGMILYAFSRRLRPVAPRRVPVADATR